MTEPSHAIQYLKGVGPRFAALFAAREIRNVEDLLRHLPRRYEHALGTVPIRSLVPDTNATVAGEVTRANMRYGRGRRMLDVALRDDTGTVLLTWFRVPGGGFADRFQKGRWIQARGTVSKYRNQIQMRHPETRVEVADAESGEAGESLIPVYSEVPGIRPSHLRKIVGEALRAMNPVDTLPVALREKHQLPALDVCYRSLHEPAADTDVTALNEFTTPWHRRFIYEELLLMQLAVLRRRARVQDERAPVVGFDPLPLAEQLFAFQLTGAQQRVLREIAVDLAAEIPMHRLLQGDVGSGKTAVALTAVAGMAKAGFQSVIMAPTEILAEQHMRAALKSLTPAGVRVALLTGSMSAPAKREVLGGLKTGKIQVVVGTHALIQDGVAFARLGLAIVDEQHRFGVAQRMKLLSMGRASTGLTPHMVVMTATPIPRTLALTVYGDLDVGVIDELPPGRQAIRTVRARDKKRADVFAAVRDEVAKGRQAYVVYPLVEASEAEGFEHLRDAISAQAELAQGHLKGLRVGLLHGKMASEDKDRIMRAFAQHTIDVLVATTVVEVGIDVPNATVMVIEHAERFGLSQLHQLRGRVGRGEHSSLCFLVAGNTQSEEAWRRLQVMEKSRDGFVIAEEDLKIRGPGDFMGTRQSGLPMLALSSLSRDADVLEQARADAQSLLASDPEFQKPDHQLLGESLRRQWAMRAELAAVG